MRKFAVQLLLLVCVLASPAVALAAAAAFCLPDVPHYRYVGDTASDAHCTDDSIQDAIQNTACPNTTIVITSEHTYTAQHLEIDGKDVTLQGTADACGPPGFCGDACPPPPTAPLITVSGEQHSGDSVLYIHGNSHVTIRYLTITNGSNFSADPNTSTYGGGIHFDGSGALTIDTSTISNNAAVYGGGIQFTGSGGFAGLTLLGYTQIVGNTATNSGGGIRIGGNAFLSALYDHTTLLNNHAPGGFGGGLNVVGPAHADLASPGFGGFALIAGNEARYGGGIAATAGDGSSEDAEVQLFTVDPQRPVRIDGNFASDSGGAIFLKTYYTFLDGIRETWLCAFDFRIENNAAPEGSAIESRSDSLLGSTFGNGIWLNRSDNLCRGLPASAQRCASGVTCNTVAGNVAEDGAATPTDGAAIHLESESSLDADRVDLRANAGGYAVKASGQIQLRNCLIADGTYAQQPVRNDSDSLTIGNCTIAGNTFASDDTIHAEGSLALMDSLVYQPGHLALAFTGYQEDKLVQYVLANETASLAPHGEGVGSTGAPGFVDAAGGDYHLSLASPAIDYAPHVAGNDRDLDGLAHDRDLAARTNYYGALDLGAYERQPDCSGLDTVFCDGFEP